MLGAAPARRIEDQAIAGLERGRGGAWLGHNQYALGQHAGDPTHPHAPVARRAAIDHRLMVGATYKEGAEAP